MKLLDPVVLLEPSPKEQLLKGQLGTIVEILDPGFFEVEFLVGEEYITVALAESSLMPLHLASSPVSHAAA
ncbi:DUF4926 domain-containing protein [Acidithiobacillus sp. IBUN Pt1247-S3]|uniref:DUF4926 domain-containing protein n=1 Tax=Acidithiobacillus sp. IBUN Pt1247-S3 TaxID=3166642 RepID=UPI0034E4B809